MKIIIPCDWKTVDLEIVSDPNDFGEALRNYCFVGNCEDTGCYSTFKLLDFFKEIKEGKIYNEVEKILQPDNTMYVYQFKIEEKDCWMRFEDLEGVFDKIKTYEPYEIVVAWEWDGDGTLYFRFNNHAVINKDCKCDYTWEWVR